MLHLIASLLLVAVTLIGARRYGVRRVALPACLPLVVSMTGTLQWVLISGLAPAPLIGLLAAVQVERGRTYGQIIALAAAPGLALALMLMVTLDGSSQQRQELTGQISESLTGMGAQVPEPEQLEQVINLVLQLFPGMAFLSMLFVAVVGYGIATSVSGRVGVSLPPALPMRQWRLWESMIWGPVACLALILLGGEGLRTIAANALVVFVALFAVQGLALVRYGLWRLGAQRFLEFVIYVLLLFTSGLSVMILGMLGLMDTWFDWRRLGPSPDSGDDESHDARDETQS